MTTENIPEIPNEKTSKNYRILDLYIRLCEGKTINKELEASRYAVDARSIQRDIDDIRSFLAERMVNDTADNRTVVYSRQKKGFVLSGDCGSLMNNSEILAVCKILLESRAFPMDEIGSILDKLIGGCVPQENRKLVSELIANEKYHYVTSSHTKQVTDKLWALGEEIQKSNLIKLTYSKQVASSETVTRIVGPAAIIFSEYYFYLIAYIMENTEKGTYQKKYDYPAVFRIDRIESFAETGQKFTPAYADRFEEGAFRKRVQFMFPGPLTRLQLRYTGNSVEAIMDRLPTARILSQTENEYILEAEVYGKGILMWLLSQGKRMEVLKPASMREEMRVLLKEMYQKYEIPTD